jgi:hypothetical protein
VGNQYNLKNEMIKYCINDCKLLCEGLKRYRYIVKDITGGCDVLSYITIASIAKNVYTTLFLKEKTIGIQQTSHINSSILEKEWLDYMNVPMRQYKIGNYVCDGYDPQTNTIYEFNGFHFHGCNACYNEDTQNRSLGCKYGDLYSKWIENETILRKSGNVEVMWEHTWNDMKKTNQDVINFIKQYSYKDAPLQLEVAGGRTEVFKSYYKCNDNERTRYYDFTSLYPTINFGRKRGITSKTKNEWTDIYYPIGHPTIY